MHHKKGIKSNDQPSVASQGRSSNMSFSLFSRKSVDGDRAALAFRVLGEDCKHVWAAGLEAGDVEVGMRALNLGHDRQRVAVLGLEDKGLRKSSVVSA